MKRVWLIVISIMMAVCMIGCSGGKVKVSRESQARSILQSWLGGHPFEVEVVIDDNSNSDNSAYIFTLSETDKKETFAKIRVLKSSGNMMVSKDNGNIAIDDWYNSHELKAAY